jgi:hypothetical protein
MSVEVPTTGFAKGLDETVREPHCDLQQLAVAGAPYLRDRGLEQASRAQ